MTTATLISTKKIDIQVTKKRIKTEEVYTYETTNGNKLTFHAHPTRAWNWIVVKEESNAQGIVMVNKIVNAFITATIDGKSIQTLEF